MKVGILAGGLGTRLAEETEIRPKPMVEIGGRPILWHIMMHYYSYGHRDFAVALGYKGDYIKRWFKDFGILSGDMRVETATGQVTTSNDGDRPDWTVNLFETGLKTMTGGRIKRLQPYFGNETFMLTWGDGVSDVDLDALLRFHRAHGKLATVTAVRPPARYGNLEFDGDAVTSFTEKSQIHEGWINGAFFVLEPGVMNYIEGDEVMFEHAPMERLAADGQLMAYRHESFWQCMDTLREKHLLEELWQHGNPPWKRWS
ncbi:glucose-1-phosphate cytidylyltransferase [Thiocapsa bogorovii]|uniref:glucose-1-phosphate cytidylyltransferase n=1 Tax=Thiocapsa bogorovii TaxID=521689 RepID=UPI001E61A137|nr:glucose-1-phosphate cytidylyltransferase [Thiocapsa bogorovii]UHD17105.1 glucose-1-phosphate cytidylyltransferase [Thiocapsa bogorovii]